ncbi:glycosyltransferase [Aquimarina sp. ERC-38]|uniref:glycosyltransferase n=1 Tax=Aquimarina sp. ERC-38 TaxID=2949996 RepID=UPI0022479DE1|nr:glycosyltransferase [Aquimarina sp. ERC-38]UZO80240.1 glycosyltransferase [Aquimarina sp. ERC-38]
MKIKILFILPSLRAGGAERVITFLSQHLDKQKFTCILLIIGFNKEVAYDTSQVKTIFLDKERVSRGIWSIVKILKKEKPDITMSSIGHLNRILGLLKILFPSMKFIAREANVSSVLNKITEKKKLGLFQLSSFLSSYANQNLDKIVCQSNDMLEDVQLKTGAKIDKTVLINNPIVTVPDLMDTAYHVNSPLKLITVGRLCNQKGQLRILDILQKLNFPFTYTLIGDGPKKEEIFEKIDQLKLQDCIKWIPFTTEVTKHLAMHDVFIQGSYVEGFPNALIESLVIGTPAIAFDTPGGTREIILNGINGFKVETSDEFVDQIKLFKSGEFKSSREKVRESVLSRYSADKIIAQYEKMFLEVVSPNIY